jgi:hypothetical protein
VDVVKKSREMNGGLFFLYVMVIIIIILFIVVNIMTLIKYKNRGVIIPERVDDCKVAYDTLIDVEKLNCCYIGSTPTSKRYVPELDMVVSPNPVYYNDVCKQFCPEGYDNGKCLNGIGQDKYDNCVKISKPDNCIGRSMPVAHVLTTYYYPNSATDSSCKVSRPCGLI